MDSNNEMNIYQKAIYNLNSDEERRMNFYAVLTISIGIVLLLVLPILFTQPWGWFILNRDTAYIGDSIGGMTAPIIGIISTFLIYLSFRAQIKMNKRQWEEMKNNRQRSMLLELKDNILIRLEGIDEQIKEDKLDELFELVFDDDNIDKIEYYLSDKVIEIAKKMEMIYLMLYPILFIQSLDSLKVSDLRLLYSLEPMTWELASLNIFRLNQIEKKIYTLDQEIIDQYNHHKRTKLSFNIYEVLIKKILQTY
ncbi:hypothetical protein [uncultured Draconibacterium sp.]|uniref:hypothetical protein n=1 Tax=uncultured Draconibacterium sp. TaxID=1573823 RepID=UPI002AA6470C|nr:hypothetical protein [uncultured Draconibacterium sp.]